MTVLVRGENSYFMGAQAELLDDIHEAASDWTSKYIQPNPAIAWISGKYVEADNPNSNRQAWALEDLRISQPTIAHAPMNMVHARHHIVGAYVGTEMISPVDSAGDATDGNPHIEVVGAMWKYYFPEEYKAVQKAFDDGNLFFSMECVAKTITFEDTAGVKETFPYRGPRDASYGEAWNTNREAIRWLDQPHFLAGALIIPPTRPGWIGAEVQSVSKYVDQHQELAEAVYSQAQSTAPHLSPEQLEQVTLALLRGDAGADIAELVRGNSISSDTLTKISSDEISDDTSSQTGGDNVSDTFTEDEVKAKVAEALTPIVAELEALKAEKDAEGVEARIAELKAQYEGEVEEAKTALDNAVLEATAAKTELAETVAYLESEVAAAEAAKEAASRKDERVSAVKEVANFPEDHIEANADRWASMNDEDFASLVEGFKVAVEAAKAGSKTDEKVDTKIPAETAMNGEQVSGKASDKLGAYMRSTRSASHDPRNI